MTRFKGIETMNPCWQRNFSSAIIETMTRFKGIETLTLAITY